MDNRQLGDALHPEGGGQGALRRPQGVAKSNAEWRAWLERKDAAEALGLAFDEPPPDGRE